MIPTATKEIDGVVFQVAGLPLREERQVIVRLAKTVGPAVAEIARVGREEGIPKALQLFLGGLEDADVDFLIATFSKVTKVQVGETEAWVPYMDSAFKKGAASQMAWLWFCLEHQFTDFLGSTSSKLAQLQGLIAAKAVASQ